MRSRQADLPPVSVRAQGAPRRRPRSGPVPRGRRQRPPWHRHLSCPMASPQPSSRLDLAPRPPPPAAARRPRRVLGGGTRLPHAPSLPAQPGSLPGHPSGAKRAFKTAPRRAPLSPPHRKARGTQADGPLPRATARCRSPARAQQGHGRAAGVRQPRGDGEPSARVRAGGRFRPPSGGGGGGECARTWVRGCPASCQRDPAGSIRHPGAEACLDVSTGLFAISSRALLARVTAHALPGRVLCSQGKRRRRLQCHLHARGL